MSLSTRDSGRLARDISSSFPNTSRETAFFGNHQLSTKNWNDSDLSIIFSSSGGRSNGQGRNGAIREKIYAQESQIETLQNELNKKKEKKKQKKKQAEDQFLLEFFVSDEATLTKKEEEKTTSIISVEEIKEEEVKVNENETSPPKEDLEEMIKLLQTQISLQAINIDLQHAIIRSMLERVKKVEEIVNKQQAIEKEHKTYQDCE